MDFSMAGRNRDRSGAWMGGASARRTWCRTEPECEVLEARALLAATVSAGSFSPSADVVAKAQSVISGGAAAEFSRYQADLQHAEASSRLTAAAFANLKSDDTSLIDAIEVAPLTPQAQTQDLVELQDVMDQTFIDASLNSSRWNQVSQQLGIALYGVTFTTNLPDQAFTDMQTVAKQARVTGVERQKLVADEKAIDTALGPNVDTTLGGAVPRDPVVVYYDGQVAHFVHKR
jgi:hypothetical protein